MGGFPGRVMTLDSSSEKLLANKNLQASDVSKSTWNVLANTLLVLAITMVQERRGR